MKPTNENVFVAIVIGMAIVMVIVLYATLTN